MKNYSGFWRRFAATFIDILIFALVPGYFSDGSQTASLLGMLLGIAYEVWMLGTYNATVGKIVMRIKVVKENGKKLTYSDALLRTISGFLSAVVFFLGFLWVIWDKKKQGWHDKIAKTVVIRA